LIRKRFSEEIIDTLMTIEWWNWSEERMARNKAFFELDLNYAKTGKQITDLLVD
jgi:hypothetical protein